MNRIWNIQLRSIQATRVKHNIDTPLQDPRVTFWGSVLPKVTEVAATPQIHSHARLPGLTEWQCGYAGTHTRLLAFTPQNFLDFGLFKKQIFNNISASARALRFDPPSWGSLPKPDTLTHDAASPVRFTQQRSCGWHSFESRTMWTRTTLVKSGEQRESRGRTTTKARRIDSRYREVWRDQTNFKNHKLLWGGGTFIWMQFHWDHISAERQVVQQHHLLDCNFNGKFKLDWIITNQQTVDLNRFKFGPDRHKSGSLVQNQGGTFWCRVCMSSICTRVLSS